MAEEQKPSKVKVILIEIVKWLGWALFILKEIVEQLPDKTL